MRDSLSPEHYQLHKFQGHSGLATVHGNENCKRGESREG